jgi:hypothetical protein
MAAEAAEAAQAAQAAQAAHTVDVIVSVDGTPRLTVPVRREDRRDPAGPGLVRRVTLRVGDGPELDLT